MNMTQRYVFPLTALAAALIAVSAPAGAEETDPEIAQLTEPHSTVSIGAGYVTDDNLRFGQYTGAQAQGTYGLLDVNVVQRDNDTGTWTRAYGRNLGFDHREARFERERQGDWGWFIDYSRVPRFEPLNISTQLTGIGTATQNVTGTTQRPVTLETERDIAALGVDAVGIDWRLPLDEASAVFGDGMPLQGNIDPALLDAPWPVLAAHVDSVLERGKKAPAHVVNLGHGVPPETDPEVLTRLVRYIHGELPD